MRKRTYLAILFIFLFGFIFGCGRKKGGILPPPIGTGTLEINFYWETGKALDQNASFLVVLISGESLSQPETFTINKDQIKNNEFILKKEIPPGKLRILIQAFDSAENLLNKISFETDIKENLISKELVSLSLGNLTSFKIIPESVEVKAGETYQFLVVGKDSEGNFWKLMEASWSLQGDIGTIDSNGILSAATKVNKGNVTAKISDFQCSSNVEIVPNDPVNIYITPNMLFIRVNESWSFSAYGEDAYGNKILEGFKWKVEGGIGDISSGDIPSVGIFTAKNCGYGQVFASLGDKEAVSRISVVERGYYCFDGKFFGGFSYPMGITVGKNYLWICDYGNNRIQKFNFDWNCVQIIGVGGNPIGVTLDKDENIYVVLHPQHQIKKYDKNGSFIKSWGSYGSDPGKFSHPCGISLDHSGNYLYVADRNNHRIQKFDLDGNFQYLSSPTLRLNYPFSLAVNEKGEIFVTDTENRRIIKFNQNFTILDYWGIEGNEAGAFRYPRGIAIDHDGNVLVLDEGKHSILIFDQKGKFIYEFGNYGEGDGQFRTPRGLGIIPNRYLLISDCENHRILRYIPLKGGSINVSVE